MKKDNKTEKVVKEEPTETISTESTFVNEKAKEFMAVDEINDEPQADLSGEPDEVGEMYIHFNDRYGNAFTANSFPNTDVSETEVMKLNIHMAIFGELKRIADCLEKSKK